ncbi:hypothetical protein [Klebsiella pneumoniae IS22]|nr:hypothetical protein [Klebsiella pneumoniae IS22]
MALMHFQFTFKQFEQRKSIRSTARKARDDFVVVQTADLFSRCLSLRYCPTWPDHHQR